MIKHVQEILAESENVSLNVVSARDFVDEIIALGNKCNAPRSGGLESRDATRKYPREAENPII